MRAFRTWLRSPRELSTAFISACCQLWQPGHQTSLLIFREWCNPDLRSYVCIVYCMHAVLVIHHGRGRTETSPQTIKPISFYRMIRRLRFERLIACRPRLITMTAWKRTECASHMSSRHYVPGCAGIGLRNLKIAVRSWWEASGMEPSKWKVYRRVGQCYYCKNFMTKQSISLPILSQISFQKADCMCSYSLDIGLPTSNHAPRWPP